MPFLLKIVQHLNKMLCFIWPTDNLSNVIYLQSIYAVNAAIVEYVCTANTSLKKNH